MGFLSGNIVNSEYRQHDDNGNQIEPDFLICNGYSTCSDFKSNSSTNIVKFNWNDVNIVSRSINSYWCIFQQPFLVIGNSFNNRIYKEGKQVDDENSIGCTNHGSCVLNRVIAQNSCTGHKLPAADFRGKIDDFPTIRTGKKITPEFFNLLADIVKFLIEERIKSPLYSEIYNLSGGAKTINLSSNITPQTENGKIKYDNIMSNLISAIIALLPDEDHCDTYPESEKNKILNTIQKGLNGSNLIVDREKAKNNTASLSSTAMILSKANIKKISDVIKKDLNDCICYSDCNGYSVCFCYGNCNHY